MASSVHTGSIGEKASRLRDPPSRQRILIHSCLDLPTDRKGSEVLGPAVSGGTSNTQHPMPNSEDRIPDCHLWRVLPRYCQLCERSSLLTSAISIASPINSL